MSSPTDAAVGIPSNNNAPDVDSDLAKAIRRTVVPRRLSRKKPPFTEEQLIVIALVLMSGPQKQEDIFYWILDNFPYYRSQRMSGRGRPGYARVFSEEAKLFQGAFERVMWQWECRWWKACGTA